MTKTLSNLSLFLCFFPITALSQDPSPARHVYPGEKEDLILYSYPHAAAFPVTSLELVETDIIVREALNTCKENGAGFLPRPVVITVDTGPKSNGIAKQYTLTYCP